MRSYFSHETSDGTRGNGLKLYQDLDWKLGKISSPNRLSSVGMGCPRKWLDQHPLRYLDDLL